eukprot:1298730-Amphidinium_carterae.2
MSSSSSLANWTFLGGTEVAFLRANGGLLRKSMGVGSTDGFGPGTGAALAAWSLGNDKERPREVARGI